MTFKTIIDYFSETPNSENKLFHRKKPLGVLIKPTGQTVEEPVTAFLQNFSMPKKKTTIQTSNQNIKFESNSLDNINIDDNIMIKKNTEQVVNPPKFEGIRIYTDGSCILNGKPNARGGWAVYFPNGEFSNAAQKYTNHPTNQRCELTAIQMAFEITKSYILDGGKIELFTDSEYSLKCLQEYCKKWSINGWLKADKNPIENRDIIEPLYNFYSMYWRQITMKHVRAHTGRQDEHSKANEIVDQMARSTIS
jgi:ribonuclease HI